ncbi:restriction endonuclease [Provencibacterium massiliense]|uniref:restriction endonuclease n=1 Tax=Provencibacterium massiliense TaxID=1841868 RepID=UPI0009A747B4|nr:restriction endonuclease [Provencibacterium massiliense]RGB67582.1 hypothetical protein DW086_06515 [Harryflintia acetispora]
MSNINTQYELFVKEIYDYLHSADGIQNIDIQHNVKLKGMSGCSHQIDVYWRFVIAGIEYQVAVECKNYKGKIAIGKLRDFNSVIEDIGNINGIFVSKYGFQSGAKEYAKQRRIKLYEIRCPEDNDWKGRMRNIHFNLNAYFKHVTTRDIKIDEEWLKSQTFIKPGDKIIVTGQSDQIYIENLATGEKISFYDLENGLSARDIGTNFQKDFVFENAYIIAPNLKHKIKVKSIAFIYDVSCSTTDFEIRGEDVARAIVRDVIEGEEQFVDIHGNVRKRDSI